MTGHSNFQQASSQTINDLRAIADTLSKENLSRLSLPEIEAAVKLVAQVVPAGNVPGMILSALARLNGRKPAVKQDVNALFKGMEQVLDHAVFTAVFALPARVIWGYQNLLRLAGRDLDECFPEGTWQFYVDYALREDTARHANETHGFDTLLFHNQIRLSAVDRLTAWTMAVIACLNGLPDLLANEWYERTSIALLQQVSRSYRDGSKYEDLFRQWESKRPYRREADGANLAYPAYRRKKFDEFLNQALRTIPESVYRVWAEKLRAAEKNDLPAYQRQMTFLAYLDPGQYGETRTPFSFRLSQVAFVYQGQYFLLPVCDQDGSPLDVLSVRAQIASMLASIPNSDQGPTPARLDSLARVRRAALPDLRLKLDPRLVADLDRLRFAPVIFNADPRPRALPLAELRRAERGCGDHALTIFDTGETFVFDQSHIFFDGSWGAALAEIMTNEALSWAGYLNLLPPAVPAQDKQHWSRLAFQINPADMDVIQQSPHCTPEADAETTKINLKACLNLRKIFKQRNDLLQLTVNDLLVLYRAVHAMTYQPSEGLRAELEKLAASNPEVASAIRAALDGSRETSPSMLIPVDASQKAPRERVYPLNVEVPLAELDLLNLHAQSIRALDAYESAAGDRKTIYAEFDTAQRTYLASLAGFGSFLKKAREIAVQGQSASVGAIKLLAHLHPVLQRLLDKVPERFELLNNLLKGREVFSNVGAVAPSSTLTRFITAKDDNEQKHLAWGVMTDAAGTMSVSLRDFRPHVAMLYSIGRRDLATLIVQDYLDSYALGFNAYIRDLFRITERSRETKSTHAKRIKRNE
jgi:hypothetical protein